VGCVELLTVLTNDVKLCECGCGRPAPIARKTRSNRSHVKGEPMRFISGHNTKKSCPECGGTRSHNSNRRKAEMCTLAYGRKLERLREYDRTRRRASFARWTAQRRFQLKGAREAIIAKKEELQRQEEECLRLLATAMQTK
jgi:hypothetical protein